MRSRIVPSLSTKTRTGKAGVAVLMLVASACGQAATPTSNPTTQTGSSASDVVPVYESPIAELLGVDFDGDDQQDEYLAAERTRVDWVTTCMAEQGFEYRAADPVIWQDLAAPDPDAPEWGTTEWVAIYGFGTSTQMFDQETVGPGLVGNPNDGNGINNVEDTNDAYVGSLSNEEQSAYWAVLYGDNSYEWDETMSDEENQAAADSHFEAVVVTGCEPLSYETASATDPYTQLYDTFGDELEAMYARVESDPEMVKGLADISRCASDAGFDFVDEQAVQEDIQQRLEPVWNEMTWPTDGMDEDAWSGLSDEARVELESQKPTLSDDGKAILAEVQQYEIEMATAVYACGFGDMFTLYQHVLMRYEQQFVDAHRSDLEAMRQG